MFWFKLIDYRWKSSKKKTILVFFNIRRWLIMCRMIMISDWTVSKTDCIKFLGILVDQHTSRRTYLDNISKEVTKSLGILHKTQDEHDKKTSGIYMSSWYTHILYTVMMCGALHMHLKEIAYSYWKKRHFPDIMHTCPLFADVLILTLNTINHHDLQLFMSRFHSRKFPFTLNDYIHSYDTRQRFHIIGPLLQTNLAEMFVRIHSCDYLELSYQVYRYLLQFGCLQKRLKMSLQNHR